MSAPIWCEIVCRECSKTTAGRFAYADIPRKAMRDEAEKAGWTYSNKHRDWYCKYCWDTFMEPI